MFWGDTPVYQVSCLYHKVHNFFNYRQLSAGLDYNKAIAVSLKGLELSTGVYGLQFCCILAISKIWAETLILLRQLPQLPQWYVANHLNCVTESDKYV